MTNKGKFHVLASPEAASDLLSPVYNDPRDNKGPRNNQKWHIYDTVADHAHKNWTLDRPPPLPPPRPGRTSTPKSAKSDGESKPRKPLADKTNHLMDSKNVAKSKKGSQVTGVSGNGAKCDSNAKESKVNESKTPKSRLKNRASLFLGGLVMGRSRKDKHQYRASIPLRSRSLGIIYILKSIIKASIVMKVHIYYSLQIRLAIALAVGMLSTLGRSGDFLTSVVMSGAIPACSPKNYAHSVQIRVS